MEPGNVVRAVRGEKIGTLVCKSGTSETDDREPT
jgi:hypothetical protein